MRQLWKIGGALALFLAVVMLLFRFAPRDLLAVFLTLAILVPLVYLALDRFAQRHQLLRLKEEALRAELNLLKSQINPHFFFNTLNNLYGLVRDQRPEAPDMVMTLSDLMRFTIYEGGKDHVLLRDELAYLDNYLRLQQIRWRPERVDLRFEREMADELIEVPPLLLIVLVENAFKHGVARLTDGAFVHIVLVATLDQLTFTVSNNVADSDVEPKQGGVGLANVRRRLALLFPDAHRLDVSRQDGIFRAELRLDLCVT